MFDDLETAEQKSEETPSDDDQNSHWWIGPWAHVIAALVFCVIYFPLDKHLWSWQVAVTAAYVVFMLCCTCGMAFKDSDDFFGNLRVPEYMGNIDPTDPGVGLSEPHRVLVALREDDSSWLGDAGGPKDVALGLFRDHCVLRHCCEGSQMDGR